LFLCVPVGLLVGGATSTCTLLASATDEEVEGKDGLKNEVADLFTTVNTRAIVSPAPYLAPFRDWPAGSDKVHWEEACRIAKV
jgi:hypothetical protein